MNELRSKITKDKLVEMLTAENMARLSPEMQQIYYDAEQSEETDWMEKTSEMQRQICRQFFPDETAVFLEQCLYAIRSPQVFYPDDSIFHEISLYRKYNRARRGELKVGVEAPNVPLLSLHSTTEIQLHDLIDQSAKPVCLIAGSYS
jgi:hypothetical protein